MSEWETVRPCLFCGCRDRWSDEPGVFHYACLTIWASKHGHWIRGSGCYEKEIAALNEELMKIKDGNAQGDTKHE